MLSNNDPWSSGNLESLSGPKKKKAPPRPPPPSANNVRTSQSFRTAGELQSQQISIYGQRSSNSVDSTVRASDLIDFATPPGSPESGRKALHGATKFKEPGDYMYRVGASIFYIKSQLKNPTPASQFASPFSPPRPSAQALLSSPAKSVQQSTLYTNVPAQQSQNNQNNGGNTSSQFNYTSSTKYHPTIIKRPNENNNTIKSVVGGSKQGGSLRSSSGSSDWSDYSQQSQSQKDQPRYGNIPLSTWDEPPTQHAPKPSSVVVPTIIKPPTAAKPSLLPKPVLGAGNRSSTDHTTFSKSAFAIQNNDPPQQRNYYDDPPDSDFDDEDFNDSFVSPPMPSDPPPPPPLDVSMTDWVDSNEAAPTYSESTYANHGSDRAYAITLYDYLPEVEGDLPLQAGDLVYLIKQIDDAWLYGQCAGVEGMFPSNYVNVVVPLPEEAAGSQASPEVQSESQPSGVGNKPRDSGNQVFFADALYKFDAETSEDISLRVGDMVKIFGRLNDDWLYGEVAGAVGQFPSNFVTPVPSDLPILPS